MHVFTNTYIYWNTHFEMSCFTLNQSVTIPGCLYCKWFGKQKRYTAYPNQKVWVTNLHSCWIHVLIAHIRFCFNQQSFSCILITALCSWQQWLHKQNRHKCCKQMHRLHKHVGTANQKIFPHSKLWLIKILRVPLSLKDSLQERC